jgi:HD-GYP domain-containing protein (c-di-GMP phosphodiesterase class II)
MQSTVVDVRISVQGLRPGMFVSRLDRPWLETAFPLEGLLLGDAEDVAMVQRQCAYVYVDPARGLAPEPRYLEFGDGLLQQARQQDEFAALRKTEWQLTCDVEAELPAAEQAFAALRAGLDDMMAELRDGRALDLRQLRSGVDAMVDSLLRNPSAFVWLKEIRRRDGYAYLHAMGTSVWAASFGRHLGMDRSELQELALAGLLCDVGKVRLPESLLGKPAALDPDEAREARRHVRHGLEILGTEAGLSARLLEAVATHHERHDGSGYPQGLRGSDVPIFGRILGLVDSYDAMTSQRPYAPSRAPHQAVAELYEQRGRLYQAELVEQFIQACGIYPTGSLVELSDGRVGVVIAVHSLRRLRPTLMLLLDAGKRPLPRFERLDLSRVELDAQGRPLLVRQGLPAGAFGLDAHELFLD